MDMTSTIKPRSDQWNSDDFLSGPQTFEIVRVSGNEGNPDQPVNIYFKDHKLPYRPSKSMRRVMVTVYGPNADKYVGKSITLFRNPDIKFGGVACGGIQISHMTDIDKPMTMVLTSSKTKRAPYTIQPLILSDTPTIDTAPILQAAREAASKGKDVFNKWWQDNKETRDHVKPIMDELKALTVKADALDETDESPM